MQKKLGCIDVNDLDEMYEDVVRVKLDKILDNQDHPLNVCFKMLPSGHRLNVPYSRTNRFRDSFVPKAVKFYNS